MFLSASLCFSVSLSFSVSVLFCLSDSLCFCLCLSLSGVCVCVFVCVLPVCMPVYYMHARCPQMSEERIEHLEPELQRVVSLHMGTGNQTEVP